MTEKNIPGQPLPQETGTVNDIIGHPAEQERRSRKPPKATRNAASTFAVMELVNRVRGGGSVEFVALGITLTREDFEGHSATTASSEHEIQRNE